MATGKRETPVARSTLVTTLVVVGLVGVAIAYRGIVGSDPIPSGEDGASQAFEDLVFSPSQSSPLFGLGIALFILYVRAPRIRRCLGARPFWWGVSLLPFGLALCGWAYYVDVPQLLIPSFAFTLTGVAAWLGGRRAWSATLPVAGVLLLSTQLPAALVNHVIFPMQLGTARAVTAVLGLVGIPVALNGDLIFTLERVFQVIESCSGYRSLETLTLSAVLYAEIFRRSRRQAIMLVFCAPFIAFTINTVRVLSIIFNPLSTYTEVHTIQGLVMIVVGVLLIAGLDSFLLRFFPPYRRIGPVRRRKVVPDEGGPTLFRGAAFATLGCALGLSTLLVPEWKPVKVRTPSVFQVVSNIDLRSSGRKVDNVYLGSVGFSARVYRTFKFEDGEVSLFIGTDDRLNPHRSLVSEKTANMQGGFEVRDRAMIELPGELTVERMEVASLREEELVFRWHHDVASPTVETLRGALALDRGPLRRAGQAAVVRISTPLDPQNPARAELRLRAFMDTVQPALVRLGLI